MRFLPYENYILTSRFSPQELRNILNEKVERKAPRIPLLSLLDQEDRYEGTINQQSFNIRRISYQNACLPNIYGQVTKHKDGSLIHIKMQMNVFVYFLTGIFLLVTTIVGIKGILNDPINFLFLLPILLYVVSLLFFKYESRAGKQFLEEVLEAEEVRK
jgi:hypothetical protein